LCTARPCLRATPLRLLLPARPTTTSSDSRARRERLRRRSSGRVRIRGRGRSTASATPRRYSSACSPSPSSHRCSFVRPPSRRSRSQLSRGRRGSRSRPRSQHDLLDAHSFRCLVASRLERDDHSCSNTVSDPGHDSRSSCQWRPDRGRMVRIVEPSASRRGRRPPPPSHQRRHAPSRSMRVDGLSLQPQKALRARTSRMSRPSIRPPRHEIAQTSSPSTIARFSALRRLPQSADRRRGRENRRSAPRSRLDRAPHAAQSSSSVKQAQPAASPPAGRRCRARLQPESAAARRGP